MDFSYDIGWLPNNCEYEEIFKSFNSAGINTIAYNFQCINNLSYILDKEYLKNACKIKSILDSYKISCNQTYAPFSLKLCDERLNRFEENYGRLVRALEFSAKIGAKQMVVYAVQVPFDTNQKEKNYKIYSSLIPYCEKFGIKLAVCSNFPKYIKSSALKTPWATAQEYKDFILSFGSEYICACVDLYHSAELGVTSEELITIVGIPILKSIHFKDGEKYRDIHLKSFSEQFDLVGIRKALESVGYKGEFTFECPSFVQDYPKELLQALSELFADIGYFVTGSLRGGKK